MNLLLFYTTRILPSVTRGRGSPGQQFHVLYDGDPFDTFSFISPQNSDEDSIYYSDSILKQTALCAQCCKSVKGF